MKDHPTSQPSGRTAEEILNELLDEFLSEIDGVAPEDWDEFAESDQVRGKEEAQRQLFNAICSEVIGKDTNANDPNTIYLSGVKEQIKGYNHAKAELRERLRVFFNQPEAAPPQPDKGEQ